MLRNCPWAIVCYPDLEKILSDELLLLSHQVLEFKDKRDLGNHLGFPPVFTGKEIGVGSNSHS